MLMADDSETLLTSELSSQPFDFTALCARTEPIRFTHSDGRVETFTPDGFKGYFEFTVATAFPTGRVIYGTGLHPQVTANHYMSLLDQHLDVEHKMAENDPKNPNAEDKIIGAVVAVTYPKAPRGAEWTLADRPSPAIHGVASFWKNSQPVQSALARHVMGKQMSTVSMDIKYGDDSAFVVKIPNPGGLLFEESPKEFLDAGYEYVPYLKAPKNLKDLYDITPKPRLGSRQLEPQRITGDYEGREVSLLMGGRYGAIHFAGLAVVKYGAEPTASIGRLAASALEHPFVLGLNSIANLTRDLATSTLLKPEVPDESHLAAHAGEQ
jgi:hypothetical protein